MYEMPVGMQGCYGETHTCGMDLGRYLSISVIANDGALSGVAALVLLIVLFWALSSPFWEFPDELVTAAPAHPGPRSDAGPLEVTSPIPRAAHVGAYQGWPRHAAGPIRTPKVTGSPPWGPAPRPPGPPPSG